jgi:uncharacterized protein (DUF1800 family)
MLGLRLNKRGASPKPVGESGLGGLALYLGATLLAALAMVSIVRAQTERPPNPPGADVLPQSAGTQQPVTDAMIWRAASRLGYAPTAELVEAIRRAPGGAQGWALAAIDNAAAASRQAPQIPQQLAIFNQPLPTLFDEYRKEREARREVRVEMAAQGQPMQPGQMQPGQPAIPRPAALADLPNISRDATQTAAAWRLLACSDPRAEDPLTARMTEFWFNHFNVFAGKGTVRPFLGHYVTNAIRPNVLGPFDQLVLATARHPAMLNYLDQSQSVAEGMMAGPANNRQRRGLNENYARELMELHTLGVHGGYSQNDVRELARVLTGWTLDPNAPSGFRFAARAHDTGEKVVLGQRFGNEGEAEGVRAIEMLATHPATAQRIALRLAQWFVADTPPKALTDRLAASFSASRGNLRTVMRTLVQSPEFWDERAQLVKTPMDYACSTLALTGGVNPAAQPGVGERRVRTALGFLAQAGQPMHGWQTPDGYKVDAATWVAPEALTRRADLAFALARDAQPAADLTRFLAPSTLARIQQEPDQSRLALMLASPEFMKK